ncbi:MAG: cobalt ECF transporter T component CbiQ [Isosphaeraceae bacterium]
MQLDLLEGSTTANSGGNPLIGLDARWKLLAALAFVVAAVATPLGAWRWVGAEALVLAFAVGLARAPVDRLFRRWLAFIALVGCLTAALSLSRPPVIGLGRVEMMLAILAKNSLAFLAMLVLASITPFPKLLGALARLGVPEVLVATLHFMERYTHVLADELGRMLRARRSRNFRVTGRLDWGILAGLIGSLMIRALERAERVESSMLARGWDGTIRGLDFGRETTAGEAGRT